MFSVNAVALGLEPPPSAHAELLFNFQEPVGIPCQETFSDSLHPVEITPMCFLNT